jgi:hypothetical protein
MDREERVAAMQGKRSCKTCQWFDPIPHSGSGERIWSGYCCWRLPVNLKHKFREIYSAPDYYDGNVMDTDWCSCWTKREKP